MASRFSNTSASSSRNALFENYDGGGGGAYNQTQQQHQRPGNGSHYQSGSPYGRDSPSGGGRYGGYESGGGGGYGLGVGGAGGGAGYRPATPNRKGQYSDAVLNELESQNDDQVSGILGKVRQLKGLTVAIGEEIRESSALAEKMNDSFDGTRLRLKGTMNRMLIMAEKTGVGWKVWLAFFAAVGFLFWYVWLF